MKSLPLVFLGFHDTHLPGLLLISVCSIGCSSQLVLKWWRFLRYCSLFLNSFSLANASTFLASVSTYLLEILKFYLRSRFLASSDTFVHLTFGGLYIFLKPNTSKMELVFTTFPNLFLLWCLSPCKWCHYLSNCLNQRLRSPPGYFSLFNPLSIINH